MNDKKYVDFKLKTVFITFTQRTLILVHFRTYCFISKTQESRRVVTLPKAE